MQSLERPQLAALIALERMLRRVRGKETHIPR